MAVLDFLKANRLILAVSASTLLLGGLVGYGIGTETPRVTTIKAADATISNATPPLPSDPTPQDEGASAFLSWRISKYEVDKNRECDYSTGYLNLQITIKNTSDKEIAAIEASADINDVFEKNLMSLNIPMDKSLAPGDSTVIGSVGGACWGMNPYIADEQRLRDMEDVHKTTRVDFNVSKIAFSDGLVKEF